MSNYFLAGIFVAFLVFMVGFLFGYDISPRKDKTSALPESKEEDFTNIGYHILEVRNSVTGDHLFAPVWKGCYGEFYFFDKKLSAFLNNVTKLHYKTCAFYRSPQCILEMLWEHSEGPYIGFKAIEDAQAFIDAVKDYEARAYYSGKPNP